MNKATEHINALPTASGIRPRVPRTSGWQIAPLLVIMAAGALAPDFAMAAVWDTTASKVLGIFTGGMTRTIAIIAVIACGLAAMFGKLSWEWAIKIVVGLVLVFGGTAIVDYFIGGFGS